MDNQAKLKLPDDFSLVQGGPLFQLFVRSRLATSGLGLLRRRIVFLVLLAWLPLLLLAAISGQALGGGIQIPFLYDLEAHIRFLLVLPLLLMAEWVVHQRLGPVVQQFVERDIIAAQTRQHFDACILSALRLRNSMWIEAALMVFVVALSQSLWIERGTLDATTWYFNGAAGDLRLTPAGYWFVYASMPVYRFIALRWVLRIVIWSRFLWQVSRLDLHLVPTHPDRAGGLGFLAGSAAAFIPFMLSQGALLSAMIASRIFYQGVTLLSFKIEIVSMVVFLLLLVLGPLCVFAMPLAQAKRQGLLAYGALASRYVREFDKKWLHGGAAQGEAFVGSGDIQSLADLANSFEVVRSMRTFPFDKETVIQIAVITLLPVLPLALTMVSLEELVQRLVGVLL